MRVITISGHAQNGKDTTAGILADKLREDGNLVLIMHYGDLVKYVCKTLFNWDGKKNERGRSLLQYVGTDVVRRIHKNYWVEFVLDMIRFFGDNWDYVLIPDTRFPNEIEYLADAGEDVIHLRVKRSGFVSPLTPEQQMHPSETALDDYKPDWVIDNNGSIDDLQDKIDRFIKEKLYGNE